MTPLGAWTGSNAVILRHDVDFDVGGAYRVAVIEHELGISASFFIMVSGSVYNPASRVERERLREIGRLGHELGLHFYPGLYADASDDRLAAALDAEAAFLSAIVESEVRSISIHQPSEHGRYVVSGKYRNAYEPAIFSPDVYLSDSRMQFGVDPYEFVERARSRPVQLLLHPEHFSEDGADYPETFERIVLRFARTIDAEFAINSTYRSRVQGSRFQRLFLGE